MALYHTLGAVQIPAQMIWSDEFAWSAAESVSEYGIDGALLVDVGTRLAGQPVTLAGAQDRGWISYATLVAIKAMADVAGATYSLTLADGRSFDVMFSPGEDPITAEPIIPHEIVPGSALYIATIRLIKV